MRSIVGSYSNEQELQRALDELKKLGADPTSITLVAHQHTQVPDFGYERIYLDNDDLDHDEGGLFDQVREWFSSNEKSQLGLDSLSEELSEQIQEHRDDLMLSDIVILAPQAIAEEVEFMGSYNGNRVVEGKDIPGIAEEVIALHRQKNKKG